MANRADSVTEQSSAANVAAIEVTHFALDWRVDFGARALVGRVTLHCTARCGGVAELVLDTKRLQIDAVADAHGALAFALGDAHADFGAPLRVQLRAPLAAVGDEVRVAIDYRTAPDASALQWLDKAQTADQTAPYLYSQCQAIHCRSMIPLQDAPGVKQTYEARVTVPAPLVALMSAPTVGEPEAAGSGDAATLTYRFEQKQCMPSYLVAIAVGALVSRDIGPRSKVWCEASQIEAAAHEFADTEKFLVAGEKLLGPYVWGKYDILMMPPSFAYGGMENPTITYVTPTLVAGDRSLANVVAHEIAHSWTGNLVTNRTWNSFWCNEGFTVFVERWIVGEVFGAARRDFAAVIGRKALRGAVEHFGADHEFTKLIPDLEGVDPDDAFSSIPYEKGFALLDYLASLVGRAEFDVMLKAYIQHFAGKTVTSEQFRQFFLKHFEAKQETLKQVDWDTWFFGTGMPPVLVGLDDSLSKVATTLAAQWLQHNAAPSEHAAPEASATSDWFAGQFMVMLDYMSDAGKALTPETLAALDRVHQFSASKNTEIVSRWLWLALKFDYKPVYDAAATFAVNYGRMKFCRPTYRALAKASDESKALAIKTFQANREKYHPIAQKMIARELLGEQK